MRTDNEIAAHARDRMPFANSVEGEEWQANWCARCLRDAPFRRMGKGSGCPLLLVALTNRTPAEWLDGPRDERGRYSLAEQYVCVEFRAPGDGGESRPRPEPRGMDGLFPRPQRRIRTLVSPSEEVPASAT